MAKKVLPAEYAKMRGVNKSTVHRAMERGRISFSRHGVKKWIDPEKADREWEENTDHTRNHYKKPETAVPLETDVLPQQVEEPPQQTETMPPISGKNGGPNQTQARTLLTVYKAQLAKMEIEREKGTYLERESTLRHLFSVVRVMRDHFLTIPDRIGAIVAAETDTHRVIEILEKEINGSLEGLSDRLTGFDHQRDYSGGS